MPDRLKICSNCGAEVLASWPFCETCGEPLLVPADGLLQVENPGNSNKKKVGLVFLVGLLFLCGCTVIAGGVYLMRQSWLPTFQSFFGSDEKTQAQILPTQLPTVQLVLKPALLSSQTPVPTALQSLTTSPTPATVMPTAPQIPTQLPINESFVWQDDFSSKESGWQVFDDNDGYASYHEGFVFAIAVSQPDLELRSWPDIDPGKPQDNATMTVKAHRVEGDGYWGMICRYSNDDTYYQLAVDEGQFAVFMYLNGSESYLTNPEWISTDLLAPSLYNNGLVPLGLSCTDNLISVTVDGQIVFETSDTSIPNGDVMLYASSYDQKGQVDGYYLKVLFDDFSIKIPKL